ncbi:MAG: hypothetical protein HDT11_00320 [Helicobacter sp.]|nr:hypothetical protein [Helicobacter sp.]
MSLLLVFRESLWNDTINLIWNRKRHAFVRVCDDEVFRFVNVSAEARFNRT